MGSPFPPRRWWAQRLVRGGAADLRRAAVLASQWGAGGALLLCALFWVGGPYLIDLMSTAPEVRIEAREFLIWAALAPAIGVASWMLDGVYIGATWTREMRRAMLQSGAVYVAALVILVPLWGNHGLWLALMVLNTTRAVTLGLRYPRLEREV